MWMSVAPVKGTSHEKDYDMLLSVKQTATAAITALMLISVTAAPADAWGRREKDTLIGVTGGLLLGSLFDGKDQKNHKAQVYYPQPYYVQPQPIYVVPAPVAYVYAPTNIYITPAAQAFNSYSSSERMRIQSTLTSYGYYHSPIDGSFGPATYSAVTAYSAATGKSAMLGSASGSYAVYDALLF